MKRIAPELIVILLGLALLVVGLSVWLGWYVAATVSGACLVLMGAWSAAGARGR